MKSPQNPVEFLKIEYFRDHAQSPGHISFLCRYTEQGFYRVEALAQDKAQDVQVIHIEVDGLTLVAKDGHVLHIIPHLPITRKALERSVVANLAQLDSLPELPAGYQIWRDQFERSKAGIFDTSVAEAVSTVEAGLTIVS